ncbi:probable 3-hydroxyisobutyryl-CoA hydrolase 3 [Typha angustifolia]|uniref:probable 3-hydroxyisobutyryl-CoA hydrolase 3 n=1 Tax=Typha angustifolia TaxID=59011 RepID=UPI003C306CAC
MAFPSSSCNQILVKGNLRVKTIILNRPQKYNAIAHQMILQLLKELRSFERDPDVKLVIIKGEGKAFCSGGDVPAVIQFVTAGHWTFGALFHKKMLSLDYLIATYKKPQVFLINGAVMGAGAGLSMHGTFRVVTEKTVFAMPEASIGTFPDVGASHFLSKLPGFLGEYLGLTGARIDGPEMLACGLATHFVLSKNLPLLEESLFAAGTDDSSIIHKSILKYEHQATLKKGNVFQRLDLINKCFSKQSVEEILSSLEHELEQGKDEWIAAAIKSIKMVSPISLKLFLRSIRQGRFQELDQCLIREYRMVSHVLRRTVSSDLYEGTRAKLLDRDNNPKWEPSKLELVSDDMLDKYFTNVDKEEDWEDLKLPSRRKSIKVQEADILSRI